ncbi:MAG: hypothetical protein LBC20_12390 [Planctomycetaceae bacterium]|nr:hypothetical protein [Planctomycetaceae bacterium]
MTRSLSLDFIEVRRYFGEMPLTVKEDHDGRDTQNRHGMGILPCAKRHKNSLF